MLVGDAIRVWGVVIIVPTKGTDVCTSRKNVSRGEVVVDAWPVRRSLK